jgi:hypothetical protein
MASGNHYNYHGRMNDGRYDATTSRFPKTETSSVLQSPPPYSAVAGSTVLQSRAPRSRFDPRGWSLCRVLVVGSCITVLIVVVIVGAYEGVMINRYPDYTRLNYSLTATYEGTTFFDDFQYYSGEDPTDGFVQYVQQTAIASSLLDIRYGSLSIYLLH